MVEPVFLATLGNPKHTPLPGLFTGVRRHHSQKPREFYALLDQRCPSLTSRVDLYARCRRPGWDSFGDELDKYPLEHPYEEVA
jgi:N6-adenosine-specific RNA methylase IME4